MISLFKKKLKEWKKEEKREKELSKAKREGCHNLIMVQPLNLKISVQL